ncbi:RsmB/NOP family class I SAM-dependent RNA methyltransferase [Defluviimonas sp. SAOS-178_SWC]|uniref:RsmB/NOP family class I SAM-dependent RNA methyltransferase n=1 Tax=Defluviimonas sp. SAOS-178_SWC TaxID=3121287 RepID=UPI003221D690
MTPAARIEAAIGILDRILSGTAAEQALTGWARASRFAGSGDRTAIRDLVFDALRCRRSFTVRAGAAAPTGRALMIGTLVASGTDPDAVFSGQGYAPAPLDADERAALATAPVEADLPELVALDCPDWIAPALRGSLGADFSEVLKAERERAPVFLRVNAVRGSRADARAALARDGIDSEPEEGVNFALKVTQNPQKIRNSSAYLGGLVELQDLSPQAAVEALPLRPGDSVLDYCAGGGGKALALAARGVRSVTAHDALPQRMRDLPARAARAGADVALADTRSLRGREFDLVLVDVPCSGTGTWRRTPDAKWTLTAERVADLVRLQADILDAAEHFVAPKGHLAYMTCSLLAEENRAQIDRFVARSPGWGLVEDRLYTSLGGGDGFYSALLTRV